jgi:outer membrane protein OmpA-like peptidoglycan-associated protein
VSRTTKAINYGYLSTPTRIDFAPTPLLTGSRGEASIEPKRGATLIQARFSNVPAPTRFGSQYLTYVLWAISPEGRVQNLGEVMLDGSGKGRLSTSTPMQTFAMILTAEPYYSVAQPSDVIVLENRIGPGTIGKVEEVNASYELLPRKAFTYDATAATPTSGSKLLPRDQYDAVLALYQAQNAIQIAESQNAERYAPERIARARALYEQARSYPARLSQEIISLAREAAQIAEDSRGIALKRAEQERVAANQLRAEQERKHADQLRAEQERKETADARAAALRSQQEQMEADRAATLPSQQISPASIAPARESANPVEVDPTQFRRDRPDATANRQRVLAALRGRFDVLDTGRGIVVSLPEETAVSPSLSASLSPLVDAVRPYRDLHLEVEGHSASPEFALTQREADRVRDALIMSGATGDRILARGFGNSRPRASNASANGRVQNRRVEIVITGDAIGSVPTWDRTYTLTAPRR